MGANLRSQAPKSGGKPETRRVEAVKAADYSILLFSESFGSVSTVLVCKTLNIKQFLILNLTLQPK